MKPLRILADDLTGALDCAAAFGAGVHVHLGHPATQNQRVMDGDIDIVATATRDVRPTDLAALLEPSLSWLRGAGVAFKKIDSLLRGNTFDEVDWLARQGGFQGVAMIPAFPAQHRITKQGQQWWRKLDGNVDPVAESITHSLQARGWRIETGRNAPTFQSSATAWVPDVLTDQDLDMVADFALQNTGWLWCGSAGLAHALARRLPSRPPAAVSTPETGQIVFISASHHTVTHEQWRVLRASTLSATYLSGEELHAFESTSTNYPLLIDLSSATPLSSAQATSLLQAQTKVIAQHSQRPRALVVVGGDTLLALCRALGAHSLVSETALDRTGWGCARLSGGTWDGVLCHTRSGAFGNANDLIEVMNLLERNFS
jgi:uncharacterized protein YgbK (DUF1537 family)